MAKTSMPRASAEQKKQERQWQVDSALSTLQRAEQIRKDASLMRDVRKSAAALTKAVGAPKMPPKKKK